MIKSRFVKVTVLVFVIISVFSIQLVSANGNRESSFYGRGMGMHGNYRGYRNSSAPSSGERLDMDQVRGLLETEINQNGNPDWVVSEVMEFEGNFYAQIGDSDSGRLLTELLIDPYSGYIQPEFGPNMMWNTEFSHMGRRGGWFSRSGDKELAVSEEDAIVIAGDWLKRKGLNEAADNHADEFPGYYTIHTLENGRISGMLSVNGKNGKVWIHDWHGEYRGMEDSHGEGIRS